MLMDIGEIYGLQSLKFVEEYSDVLEIVHENITLRSLKKQYTNLLLISEAKHLNVISSSSMTV
jgi:hypothetical protein